jgi:hypothetical protein
MNDSSEHDKWHIVVPLSSEMSTMRGAALGTLIGCGIAVASVAALGPIAIAIPSLITLASGSAGAVAGYLSHKRHEPPLGTLSSDSSQGIRKVGG